MFKKIISRKRLIIVVMIIPLYLFFKFRNDFLPIEELIISSSIGIDIIRDMDNTIEYDVSLLLNNYTNTNEIVSQIVSVTSRNLPESREDRQRKINKKFITGLEKVILLSDSYAKYGIESFVDIFFKNRQINDSIYTAICKERPEDIMKLKIPGYANTADYIEGMIDHLNDYSFTPRNYKLMDIYVRMNAEGRNVALPYLEITDGNLQVSGMALFSGSKMVQKVSGDAFKYMNLLRENDMKGIINVQESPNKYLSCYSMSSRKVKCIRENGEYTFIINLSLKSQIISNTLYDEPMNKTTLKKAIENRLKEQVEKECYDFIEKMQKEYKVDCLELGRIAAAKYGRNTGVNWDDIISKSKIVVNTSVHITSNQRGEY